MFVLKLNSKITTFVILTSLIGIQFSGIQAAFAQNYDIVPPAIDPNDDLFNPNIDGLPAIKVNPAPNVNPNQTLQGSISTVPVGAAFELATSTTVGTSINEIGDIFTATLTTPVVVNGNLVIPAGSVAIGQITYIENAGRLGKNGIMDIKFTHLKLTNGPKVPISGKIITVDNSGVLKGGSLKKQIVTTVATGAVTTGAGTLAGLTIGGIAGGVGTGAVIGTAGGGFIGLGYIIGRKGKEVTLPAATKLNVVLEQPLTISK